MATGTLVDMGGDDLLLNNLYQGVTTQGGSTSTTGAVLIPKVTHIEAVIPAAAGNLTVFVSPGVTTTYKIGAVSAVFSTASTSGTLQVEVATGTTAPASGTNQLTGTVSLAGTANTTVTGTLISPATTIVNGDRINLIFGGTMTNMAGGHVTITLMRIT